VDSARPVSVAWQAMASLESETRLREVGAG